MKRTIRENINTPYSLHDMNVCGFEVSDQTLTMKTQSGLARTTLEKPYQPDGHVEFQRVDWDFCYVYIM